MKIYKLRASGHMIRHYFEPTKKAALQKRREIFAEDELIHSVEITTLEVNPTRKGVAEALNNLVYFTCLNEG